MGYGAIIYGITGEFMMDNCSLIFLLVYFEGELRQWGEGTVALASA